MTLTPRKKSKTPKPRQIKHVCVQEEKLIEMHKAITGNGTPAEGLQVQVILLNEQNKHVNKSLEEIKVSISEMLKKYDDSIEIATKAKHAVEEYRKEDIAFDDGIAEEKKKVDKAKGDSRARKGMYITLASVLIVLLLGLNSARESYIARIQRGTQIIQQDSTNKKIDNLESKIDANAKMIGRNTPIINRLDSIHKR